MMKFLVIGLLRDRQRSLFPILIVAIGVWITVFLQAYIAGFFSDLIDSTARFSTGHVKVMSRAYAENEDQRPNDLALLGVDQITTDLQQNYPDMTWVKRIQFGGLLDIPDETGETRSQGPVAGMGVDLLSPTSSEIAVLNIEKAIVSGRLPQNPGEILISDKLARKLEVQLGETATLLSSTMHGSMTMYNFTVVGTIRFGVLAMDRGAMIADITDIQQALDMVDASGEILGYLENRIYIDEKAAAIVNKFNADYLEVEDEFGPVMGKLKELSNLSEYFDMVDYFSGILVSVFVLVMSIVLWNAGLLGGLRRYGEVGIRLAIGEYKGQVYRSMIYESVLIGIVGSIIGTGLGLGSAYWLQVKGLDISSLMRNVNMMFPTVIRADITSETYYIGFFPGLFATVLGTALSGIGIYKRQTAQLFKELGV
ncbi:ABC transporter permease [candidate division CSSED10-310 bacterium]|uniref:ABC transporter permease n=1 Tax=candidate division CSSED10-310 bacterium TaxID=2855610 RepID=A0ABV6YWF1_UNCC1